MSETWETLHEYLVSEEVRVVLRVVAILLGGLLLARLIRRRLSFGNMSAQHQQGLRRFGSYVVLVLTAAWALQVAGVELSMLLGAAGILTVAIGFAAQTSASNLISGLFLMGERPFVVGDLVEVEGVTGFVLAIDLMSVKLRTFDNLMVRIPNETMLKTNVINLSHFPIRRVDLAVGVAYKEDITQVRALLFKVADRNPLCLEEPKPQFYFKAYGDSALELQFSAWTTQENFFALKSSLLQEIKEVFDRDGIEIPFPHLSLYAGSVTDPMPLRVQGGPPL